MGFRPEVHLPLLRLYRCNLNSLQVNDFQPLYAWNERKGEELRNGAQVLQEAIELAEQKSARSQRNAAESKAAAEAAAKNVCNINQASGCLDLTIQSQALLAFMDDRKTKMLRDQRDRHNREIQARHSSGIDGETILSPSNLPSSSSAEMPGNGRTLSSSVPIIDEPPPCLE